MYTCGLTVYARGHIGNFRTFVALDVLRRALALSRPATRCARCMNFTDVDDRTILESQKAGVPLREYTDRYIDALPRGRGGTRARAGGRDASRDRRENIAGDGRHDQSARAERPHLPRATARSTSRSRRFPTTASWRSSIMPGIKSGARIDSDKYDKEDARDFVLWKATKDRGADVGSRRSVRVARAGTSSARRWRCACSASRRSTSTPAASI